MPTTKKIILAETKHDVTPIEIIVHTGEEKVKGFVDFLRTQGVMGLAVGIVLGGAVTVLARSLIDNIIMPPLGLLLGSAQGLKGLSVTIGTVADGGKAVLYYGSFINDFINFLLIALVVYTLFNIFGLRNIDVKKPEIKPEIKK